MNQTEMICPKCHAAMEEGFIIDHTHGGIVVSEWLEGEPETSIWTGLKTKGREKLDVQAYRCVNCGYLEFYAR